MQLLRASYADLPESIRRVLAIGERVGWASAAVSLVIFFLFDWVIRSTVSYDREWIVRDAIAGLVTAAITLVSLRYTTQGAARQARDQMAHERVLAFLAEVGQQLSTTLDFDEALEHLARLAVPTLADVCVIRWFGSDDTPASVRVVHIDPERKQPLEAVLATGMRSQVAARIVDDLLRSGQPKIISHLPLDHPDGDERRAYLDGLRDLQTHSAIMAPLSARGQHLGIMTLMLTQTPRTYEETDLRLAETLANRAALALDNARLHRAAQHQALHDALTELPNRAFLKQRLRELTADASAKQAELALLLLDLDGFKDVNDTLGHHAGDVLIREVADRLRGCVGEAGIVARLGGDEFAVVVPDCGPDHARQMVEHLLDALESRTIALDGHSLALTASVGIVSYPTHGQDYDVLLRRADVAMYAAKRTRSRYALYQSEQDAHTAERLALMGELRHAVGAGQLVLHYQPRLELRSGTLTGLEALVRWVHPRRGLLAPDQFIPLAEQTGVIEFVTRWVIDTAANQGARWRAQGLDLPIAVNLSMRDLHDPTLPLTIADALEKWSGQVDIEITESALMEDPQRAMSTLARLTRLGVRVAIDDFGTGYSSLSYLKQLPVHVLKIDRSFVRDLAADASDEAIVRSTIDLAHNLGHASSPKASRTRPRWTCWQRWGATRPRAPTSADPSPPRASLHG